MKKLNLRTCGPLAVLVGMGLLGCSGQDETTMDMADEMAEGESDFGTIEGEPIRIGEIKEAISYSTLTSNNGPGGLKCTNNGLTIGVVYYVHTPADRVGFYYCAGNVPGNDHGFLKIASGTGGGVGPTGPAGATGPQGANGATGASGTNGTNGLPGATGPQGAQGTPGATGPQGPAGTSTGAGPTGPQGPQGAQGPQGGNGTSGTNGATGATGPQGAKGATGANGLNGTNGATGPQGANGANGLNGAQGPQGATGSQGAVGANGATGAQGPQGANGTNGLNGATGAQGANGATGAQGPQGANGVQGANGATGAQGANGATGAQGANGATGAQGAQGAQGAVGSIGPVGAQGAQGVIGARAFVATSQTAPSCANGGATIQVGLDTNGNGVFDIPAEVTGTTVICNGTTGSTATCGNNIREGAEVCDGSDPTPPSGQFCNATCTGFVGPTAACTSCTEAQCADQLFNCDDQSDNVPASPNGSCRAVEACVHVSWNGLPDPTTEPSCAIQSSSVCYCGTADLGTCLGGTSNGVCKEVIRQQSGCIGAANEPQCILGRQNDTEYGYGDAFQIVNCQRNNCSSECGIDP